MGDGVEEQFPETFGRRAFRMRPDVGAAVPAVLPATQQTGGAAAAVDEADPQQRQFLDDAAENASAATAVAVSVGFPIRLAR